MPLYDFKCPQGHVHEAMTDALTRTQPCPECPAPTLAERLPPGTRTTFRFADQKLKR